MKAATGELNLTVITLIDGNIYDIVNSRFVSDNQKIIHYGNILKYFSENEISVGLISPYEVPGYEEETACIELGDVYIWRLCK